MTSKEELTKTITRVIQETLALKGVQAPALTLDTAVNDTLGLDSLDWAAIVAVLEEETQLDPFSKGLSQDLRTMDDLVCLYLSEVNPSIEVGESVQ